MRYPKIAFVITLLCLVRDLTGQVKLPFTATEPEIVQLAQAAESVVRGYFYVVNVNITSDAPWVDAQVRVKKWYKGSGEQFLKLRFRDTHAVRAGAANQMPEDGKEYICFVGPNGSRLGFLDVQPEYLNRLNQLFPTAQTQPDEFSSASGASSADDVTIRAAATKAITIFQGSLDYFLVRSERTEILVGAARASVVRTFKGNSRAPVQFFMEMRSSPPDKRDPMPQEEREYIFFLMSVPNRIERAFLVLDASPENIKRVQVATTQQQGN